MKFYRKRFPIDCDYCIPKWKAAGFELPCSVCGGKHRICVLCSEPGFHNPSTAPFRGELLICAIDWRTLHELENIGKLSDFGESPGPV